MTAWLGALLLVVGVLVLCRALGLLRYSRRVLTVAQESFLTIGDPTLEDEVKEEVLQRQALHLFRLFGILLVAGAAAFLLPLGLLWLADRLGALSWDDVLAATLSWPFLSLTLLATVLVLVVHRRRRRQAGAAAPAGFENRYSGADRWLHYLAFAGGPVQIALARTEDRVFRRRLADLRVGPPVFITALPRAGTTLLLNLCAQVDGFYTHTYRRMPFVLMPLYWERFSRRFRVDDAPRERAHGDGMLVSADSPEALEEMIWLNFWSEHYGRDRIRPWQPEEESARFERFFAGHLRKLALASGRSGPGPARYVSKNNGNSARVGWLVRHVPGARVVVPFRPPLQHAASLWRQHQNFLAIHSKDTFARHYMAGIGHFDFGANLRPIDFDEWTAQEPRSAPTELEFWVRYWIAGYRALLREAGERVCFVDFNALCAEPEQQLRRLARFLELTEDRGLLEQAPTLRRPRLHDVDASGLPAEVLAEADRIYEQLKILASEAAR